MKLNNRALMMSAGIGVAINVLLQLCFGSAGFAPLAGPDAATAILGFVGIVGIVSCLCGGIIALGVGFAYVYFAVQDGSSIQPVDASIGGALANGIAGLIGGLVSACMSAIAPIVVTSAAGGSPDVATALAGGIGGIIGAICGGFFIGAIFGAVGGLIGALTIGKPKTA
jgi:hypothetical protein